ncbi:unnamed protein product [Cochlearia groenlandica]
MAEPMGQPQVVSEAKVHIVFTEKSTNEEPKTYHLRLLTNVLGSQEAAEKALVNSYKEATSGFSAKLTPDQVTKMSKQQGVIKVMPSENYQMHTPNVMPLKPVDEQKIEAKVHIIFTEKPKNEEPKAYHLRILSYVLGSQEAAEKALIHSYKEAASGFSAKLTPDQVTKMSKQEGVIKVVKSETYQLHDGGSMLN